MKLKRKLVKETGQAMAEFALVLPIIILLIGGIIDFGWIFSNKLIANNACREGARYAAIYHDASATKNKVAAYIGSITVGQVIVTTPISSDTNVTVSVDYKVPILTPVLMSIVRDKDFKITAAVTMKAE